MTGQKVEPMLQACMDRMIHMLNEGQVLEALDTFYDKKAHVFENGYLFAASKEEALERQRPFLEPCSKIDGDFTELYRSQGRGILVLQNQSSFDHPEYGNGKIDGVHVYYWQKGHVSREEYASGGKAGEALAFWRTLAQAEAMRPENKAPKTANETEKPDTDQTEAS
ncbi:MAG: hypothetical protein HWE08_00350 [Alphaproteobacteria bacterium]|nr:hypothetical protein [Alphaproteobacteria bacterium]